MLTMVSNGLCKENLIWGLLSAQEGVFSTKQLRFLRFSLKRQKLAGEDLWQNPSRYLTDTKQIQTIAKLRDSQAITLFKQQLLNCGARIVLYSDSQYPPLLAAIPDAPVVLFVIGNARAWQQPCLAVVGSRKAGDYSNFCLRCLLDSRLKGVSIVSGLMVGVDLMAHERALSQGLASIAVLGYGIDYAWPAAVKSWRQQIINAGGVIVSEYAPGVMPRGWRFVRRNRLVAGMSAATLVIQAAVKSGSLITANCALDYGRDVLAVPGAINQPLSVGTNQLIQRGAYPVTSSQEIQQLLQNSSLLTLEQKKQLWLNVSSQVTSVTAVSALGQRICQALQQQALNIDELSVALAVTPSQVQNHLSLLELEGMVQRCDTGEFALVL